MLTDIVQPGILEISPYRPGKSLIDLGITDGVKLASNENPHGPPQSVISAIYGAMGTINRYPDGSGMQLRQKLADHLTVPMEHITMGNGSNDVLDLVIKLFAGPGDEVVIAEYAFLVYQLSTLAAGARPVIAPCPDWQYDLDAMLSLINHNTKLVILANPDNPTGRWLNKSDLRKFLSAIDPHIIVLIDEAYFEYVVADDHPDCSQWIESYANLVVTRTFSKIYAMAGLRIGYAISSKEIADYLNRLRHPFNCNHLAQIAAKAALDEKEFVANSIRSNLQQKSMVEKYFSQSAISYLPSRGNFITFTLGEETNRIYNELLAMGIITRPLDNYNMPHHLRVTVGLEEENRRFLAALSTCMNEK